MEHFKGSRGTRSSGSSISSGSLLFRPMSSTISGNRMNKVRLIMISIFVIICVICVIGYIIHSMFNKQKKSEKYSMNWEGVLDIFGLFLM